MRAVVDSNVWVSALLNPAGAPAQVLTALQGERFVAVISEALLAEIERVLARPRLVRRLGLSATTPGDLAAFLRERAELVELTGSVRLCRDPSDDMVIETALNGHAEVVVTRDDDLKGASELIDALQKRGVAVLTVRRFLAVLEEEARGSG